MIATIFHSGKEYKVDFFKPIDISMPLTADAASASAWYVGPMKLEPVVMGDWVGDVNREAAGLGNGTQVADSHALHSVDCTARRPVDCRNRPHSGSDGQRRASVRIAG